MKYLNFCHSVIYHLMTTNFCIWPHSTADVPKYIYTGKYLSTINVRLTSSMHMDLVESETWAIWISQFVIVYHDIRFGGVAAIVYISWIIPMGTISPAEVNILCWNILCRLSTQCWEKHILQWIYLFADIYLAEMNKIYFGKMHIK